MVVVSKSNGSPRRTVDYQQLNSQCLREPNYCESPFHTCRRVPPGTWKSTIDAVDGYHSVELDQESSKLTTFITPWGRYRYLRFPQGHCSAGDAFNGRIQQILCSIPRLVRIVDDICIFDTTIEGAFWHMWDLLSICAKNGIVVNKSKFHFCSKQINFAGLSLSEFSIQPSEKMLNAIKNFPPPNNISKARAFFGLVTQVQWAYSNSPEMAPFRSLVRPNSTYTWTPELENLFESCKSKIIDQVREGVRKFDINRATCLQTDYCKEGLGYLLLQKYCSCPITKSPLCCKEGWHLVFAGSRFTKGAEQRYSPTEGEALAVAWALKHASIFTKGCTNLIISTDHLPLLGILNNKPLEEMKTSRLSRLKEQTLQYRFSIFYNPGKWHRAPDALSRSPCKGECLQLFAEDKVTSGLISDADLTDDIPEVAIAELSSLQSSITLEEVIRLTKNDSSMCTLKTLIQSGFPLSQQLTDEAVRSFFNVKEHLWIKDELIMFKNRLVIPKSLRAEILHTLHSAHQGTEGMRARATNCVYWPGINHDIKQIRNNCKDCNNITPSQAKEPLQLLPISEYPFQHICADEFEIGGNHYVSVVDRYSGWILIYHVKTCLTSQHLIKIFRSIFTAYGVSEKVYTDGGLPFQSREIKQFFNNWNVVHITSSAGYPQANGRAELAVKSAKRLLMSNLGPGGNVDNDKAAKALLQYRNTPIKDIGLSPAQILFHRCLRDSIPVDPQHLKPHKMWVMAAANREKLLEARNATIIQRYNTFSKTLTPIDIGSNVIIQDPHTKRWNRHGIVVETEGRKYTIRINDSNRVVTRNRKFLKVNHQVQQSPDDIIPLIQTSNDVEEVPGSNIGIQNNKSLDENIAHTPVIVNEEPTEGKKPLMLRCLKDYNKPGLKEKR